MIYVIGRAKVGRKERGRMMGVREPVPLPGMLGRGCLLLIKR